MPAPSHRHGNDYEPERSNVIPFASRPPPIQITKGRDLFTWTWHQLEQSQPRIAVNGHVVACLEDLFGAICAGRSMRYPPIEWSVIFAEIRWGNVYDRNGYHCALVLLGAVGQLCDTLIWERGGRVPHIRACEMMLSHWDRRGTDICYDCDRNGTYLVSTPACEPKFGVQVKVRLLDEPLDDVWWTLQGEPDWP